MCRIFDISAPNWIVMKVIQLPCKHIHIHDHLWMAAFFPELVFLKDFMFLLENPELFEERVKVILLKKVDDNSGRVRFEIVNSFG